MHNDALRNISVQDEHVGTCGPLRFQQSSSHGNAAPQALLKYLAVLPLPTASSTATEGPGL